MVVAEPEERGSDGATGEPEHLERADAEETHRFLKGIVEALLFVAETPLSMKELARAAKIDKKRTTELVTELTTDYAGRGIQIQEIAGGFCFRSNPEFAGYVRSHLAQRPVRLSRAQLETLAIIAYRQPITRPEIDDIRGVDSGPVLKGLLERDLVKILGKKDEPGRPMLYGTTTTFLELFSMRTLEDLPTLKEFAELSEESKRRFEQSLGEGAPDGPIDLAAAAASVAGRASSAEPGDASESDGPMSDEIRARREPHLGDADLPSRRLRDEEDDEELPRGPASFGPDADVESRALSNDDDDDDEDDNEDDDDDDEDDDDDDDEDDEDENDDD